MAQETANQLNEYTEKHITGDQKPLPVSKLLSETGPTQGIDIQHHREAYPEIDDVVLDATAALDQPINDGIETLLLDYPIIHRTPYRVALKLTTQEWNEEFGAAPPVTGIDSWEPVQNLHTQEFVVSWDMENEDQIFDESRHAHLPGSDREHVLLVSMSYAEELNALGILSRKQAQAYFLQRYGYSNQRIAELLDVELGTASSHLSRARKKLNRINHGTNLIQDIETSISQNPVALNDRCGNLYFEPGLDQYVFIDRLENWGGEDNPFYVYMVLFEDGEYTDVGIDRVPLSMQAEGDREPSFSEPFEPNRMSHDIAAVKDLAAGDSLPP